MKRLKNSFTHRRAEYTLLCFLFLFLILQGCSKADRSGQNNSNLNLNKDHFPHKVEINHAIGFNVVYHNYWKELQLFRHYNETVDTVRFALVLQEAPQPEGFEDIRIIQIPTTHLATVSTTHIGMFEMLDALDQLKAVEAAKYVSSKQVHERVKTGAIKELAPAGMLNVELVLENNIEVLLGVGYPNSQNENYQSLEIAGIPVLLNADWQEKSLLGRAEWVKMLAALLNKEEMVNEKFKAIEVRYNAVLDQISAIDKSPLTITGLAQGDAWYVAGGRSFAHELLKLADVEYPWSDNESTGGLRLDFETVYEYGLKADYWMVPSTAKTLDEILTADARYADFKSFKEKQIYNIYGRYTPNGGNDFYESAVVNPDVVLKDIIKIFHPEILPDYDLVYYNHLQ